MLTPVHEAHQGTTAQRLRQRRKFKPRLTHMYVRVLCEHPLPPGLNTGTGSMGESSAPLDHAPPSVSSIEVDGPRFCEVPSPPGWETTYHPSSKGGTEAVKGMIADVESPPAASRSPRPSPLAWPSGSWAPSAAAALLAAVAWLAVAAWLASTASSSPAASANDVAAVSAAASCGSTSASSSSPGSR